MSELKVEVCNIKAIDSHPNADRLEIATVKGWKCIVPIGKYKVDDLIVYFPVDSILPSELSDRLDVTKYLSKQRIRAARLRGVVSYGLVISNENNWEPDANVTEHYGVTKYEPPESFNEDVSPRNPMFHQYTTIERLQNYPDMFDRVQDVVYTEKCHGINNVLFAYKDRDNKTIYNAASHRLPRKEGSVYWSQFTDNIKRMIDDLLKKYTLVTVYQEIIGSGIQKGYNYGMPNSKIGVVFDLNVDGRYLDYDEFRTWCKVFDIVTVPELYHGKFDLDKLDAIANKRSNNLTTFGGDNLMEGIVIKSTKESIYGRNSIRVIAKYLTEAFELDRNKTERH